MFSICSSIAIWDYSEAKYWHPPLLITDTIKRFVPSQVVTPVVEHSTTAGVADIGQLVAIRSLYAAIDVELLNGYNSKQVITHTKEIRKVNSFRFIRVQNLY